MQSFVTKPQKILADSSSVAPNVINLLKVGRWETPYHGDIELTGNDLREMVANCERGEGLVDQDREAPVIYFHEGEKIAAGWIKRVFVDVLDGVESLMGEVEWTPAGKQKLEDRELKYLSSEFNPRSYPWEDPLQAMRLVVNVITGAALTNIPLLRKKQANHGLAYPTRRNPSECEPGLGRER